MNTKISNILVVALLVMIEGCAADSASREVANITTPNVNPKSCTVCHNGNHAVDLSKFTPLQIEQKLNAFVSGRQDGYVMPKISRRMSDADKEAVSKALGAKKVEQ